MPKPKTQERTTAQAVREIDVYLYDRTSGLLPPSMTRDLALDIFQAIEASSGTYNSNLQDGLDDLLGPVNAPTVG